MAESQTTPEAIIDEWTLQLEKLLLEIATTASTENKQYYFGGGFSVDLSLGKLTRPHEDIDFHPLEKDTEYWKQWFLQRGFLLGQDPDMEKYPNAFLPTNERQDYFADVYPVTIGPNQEVTMVNQDGKIEVWPGKSYGNVQRVIYKGVPVFIESPESVLAQKAQYIKDNGGTLSDKHTHDFEILGKPLPK
jgi:hypothetical protein